VTFELLSWGAAAGLRVDKVHFANDFKFSKNEF